jgi:tRNA(Ile2) C34 agmatinyltransferase TiaS
MSIFSEKWWMAFETGKYICSECGGEMKFTNKWEDRLRCPKCGHEVQTDLYGIESEEEFDALYPILPSKEEIEKEKTEKKKRK